MANNELDDVQQRVVNETLRRRGVRSSNQIPAPEGWHYDDQGRLMPIDPALARLAKTSLQSDAKLAAMRYKAAKDAGIEIPEG